MKFSNAVYDKIKWAVQIVLPAFAALYFGIANIWSLPNPEKVVGTIAVLTTFLGVTLGISTKNYVAPDDEFDGRLSVGETSGGKTLYSLELDSQPESLLEKTSVVFKVQPFNSDDN